MYLLYQPVYVLPWHMDMVCYTSDLHASGYAYAMPYQTEPYTIIIGCWDSREHVSFHS